MQQDIASCANTINYTVTYLLSVFFRFPFNFSSRCSKFIKKRNF